MRRGAVAGPSSFDQMLADYSRAPIPPACEILELSRMVRAWQDWPGGADAAPPRVQRKGMRARSRLVAGNMRLVVSIAKTYQSRGLDLQDLVQEGALGLMRAAERFDPSRGYKFSTYSYWWIRQAMARAVDHHGPIRVAGHAMVLLQRLRRFQSDFLSTHSRLPTDEETADGLSLRRAKLDTIVRSASQASVVCSLDVPVGDGGDETLVTLLACPKSNGHLEAIDRHDRLERLASLRLLLPIEHRDVLGSLERGDTVGSIAKRYGARARDIRRLEAEAHGLLRRWMEHPERAPLLPMESPFRQLCLG